MQITNTMFQCVEARKKAPETEIRRKYIGCGNEGGGGSSWKRGTGGSMEDALGSVQRARLSKEARNARNLYVRNAHVSTRRL